METIYLMGCIVGGLFSVYVLILAWMAAGSSEETPVALAAILCGAGAIAVFCFAKAGLIMLGVFDAE